MADNETHAQDVQDSATLRPGDRVYRYVWTGGESAGLQLLTVERVNRVTVTVRTDEGSVIRVRPADLAGRADWK